MFDHDRKKQLGVHWLFYQLGRFHSEYPRKLFRLVSFVRSYQARLGQAERTGFEPAEGFDPFTDLANRRFRPLSHRSVEFCHRSAGLRSTVKRTLF